MFMEFGFSLRPRQSTLRTFLLSKPDISGMLMQFPKESEV